MPKSFAIEGRGNANSATIAQFHLERAVGAPRTALLNQANGNEPPLGRLGPV